MGVSRTWGSLKGEGAPSPENFISVRVNRCRVNFFQPSASRPFTPLVSGRNKGWWRVLKRPTGKIQLSRVDRTRRHAIHSSSTVRLDDNCFRNRRLLRPCIAPEIPRLVELDSMQSNVRSMSQIDSIHEPHSCFLFNLKKVFLNALWNFCAVHFLYHLSGRKGIWECDIFFLKYNKCAKYFYMSIFG